MGNHNGDQPRAASCGILVTGHGRFAGGLVGAIEVIMGPQDGLRAVDFPETDTAAQLRDNLTRGLTALEDHDSVVVFCDLRGGSPFNVMNELRGTRNGVEILYGVNLPLLLAFISERDRGESVGALIRSAVEDGHSGLGRFEVPAQAATPSDGDDDWA
ncbi:PTS sugar transporter subunit IIA [Streptomyces hygroscopicus]|uniref:PTS sugar transporter subunit IIA n=2 Tax=Streptomyces hygroscopicus TaxID=1912 RepID=UPI0007676FFF|nr:PTS sugar transporter subunit IIA [Streptomyces hygroscopicus]MBW8093575.1 PTS sugar transporter subunit IIA [Streptomyces hygroscopicus subsp. hygroscopicus]